MGLRRSIRSVSRSLSRLSTNFGLRPLTPHRDTARADPENARSKGEQLFSSGCIVSEFGSRRRRTRLAHEIIMKGLIDADREFGSGSGIEGSGKLAGTSNVHFAQKFDLNPVGTIAHEWIMGIVSFSLFHLTPVSLVVCFGTDVCSLRGTRRLSRATNTATAERWMLGKR